MSKIRKNWQSQAAVAAASIEGSLASKYTREEFKAVSKIALTGIQLGTEIFDIRTKVCNYPSTKIATDSCIKSVAIADSDNDEIENLSTAVKIIVDRNGEEWIVEFTLKYSKLYINGTMFDDELGNCIELNISDTRRYKAVIENMTTDVTAPDGIKKSIDEQRLNVELSETFLGPLKELKIDAFYLTAERLKDYKDGADIKFPLRNSCNGYAGWITIERCRGSLTQKENLLIKLAGENCFYRNETGAPVETDAPYMLNFPYTWEELVEAIISGEMSLTFPPIMKPLKMSHRRDDVKKWGNDPFDFLREVLE